MAFPTIPTVANGRVLVVTQANTTTPRTFPNLSSLTKNSGDLLVAIIVGYQSSLTSAIWSSWGASFTELLDIGVSSQHCVGIAYKWSTGSETGTFTVAQAGTITGHAAMILLSIPGVHSSTAPEVLAALATGTAAAADPGSLNPAGWDAEDTLWIAVAGSGETSTSGTYTGLASAPTNYTDYADTGISADAVGGVEAAVAFRQLNASSEDVGTFGVDLSNARNCATVIAVRPSSSTAYQQTASDSLSSVSEVPVRISAKARTAADALPGSSGTVYVQEDFSPDETDGWGSADVGGSWTVSTAADFDKVSGEGLVALPTAAGTRTGTLESVSAVSHMGLVDLLVPSISGTGYVHYWRVQVRSQTSHADGYVFYVQFNADATIDVTARRRAASTDTTIATWTDLVTSYTAGTYVRLKWQLENSGTDDVYIRGKLWKVADSEPGSYSEYLDVAPGSVFRQGGAYRMIFQVLAAYTGSFPAVGKVQNLLVTTLTYSSGGFSEAVVGVKGGGGTAYVQTAADALTSLSDAVARAAAAKVRTGADALATLAEAVARISAKARTTGDTLGSLSEAVTRVTGKARTTADALASVSESAARAAAAKARTAADAIGSLAEATVRLSAKARTAADALSSLSEAIVRVTGKARTAADALASIAEVPARLAQQYRSAADALGSLSEAVVGVKSGVQNLVRTTADALTTLAEATARTFAGGRAVGDALASLSEAATRISSKARTAADALSSLSEAIVRVTGKARTAADALGSLSESVARAAAAKARTAADALGSLAESVVAVKQGVGAFVRSAADALGSLAESVVLRLASGGTPPRAGSSHSVPGGQAASGTPSGSASDQEPAGSASHHVPAGSATHPGPEE